MTTSRIRHEERELTTIDQLYFNLPLFHHFIEKADAYTTFKKRIKDYCLSLLRENRAANRYYMEESAGDTLRMADLRWCDVAAMRFLDYLTHEGITVEDLNFRKKVVSNPLYLLWMAVTEMEPVHPDVINDFYHLFQQLDKKEFITPASKEKLSAWMDRHPSGLDPEVIRIHNQNRDRILRVIIKKIEEGKGTQKRYQFPSGLNQAERLNLARQWWRHYMFHLTFAARNPEDLNEMLDGTLSEETMKILRRAKEKGIPFFVNPYYLSLLNLEGSDQHRKADLAIRAYVIYSQDLVSEFGQIRAWEKEDVVVPGEPNAAGWLLPPGSNLHRRYPEVAILIPNSMGRACGGLCASCQRMYDFQARHFHFNLHKLSPRESWDKKQYQLLQYFRQDKQLRDILITGGDAFMSSNRTLKKILNGVVEVAKEKIGDNRHRREGEKYAEMIRIRLGTRLPAYLPQRIDRELVRVLKKFREEAQQIGFKQFFIQMHFESAMEITPEAKAAIKKLRSTGWMITNQMVFTAQASQRGYAAKLRQALNDIGVIPYYTFSVKGFMENRCSFATNARLVQEMVEEKAAGTLSPGQMRQLSEAAAVGTDLRQQLDQLRKRSGKPFIATDRNTMNLPGIGKSLSFRCIGLTPDGRRILSFDHDRSRRHSPIIENIGKVIIVESKSVAAWLRQMKRYGEETNEYRTVYYFSMAVSEPKSQLFSYPAYSFETTGEINHLKII